MSDEARSGTPPLAVVKEEDNIPVRIFRVTAVNASSSGASSPRATAGSPSVESKSRLSVESEPELELPPRLKTIFEKTVTTHPELAERRYAEFLHAEQRPTIGAQHDADHVKLYFPCSNQA
jgi:hypothetical protein